MSVSISSQAKVVAFFLLPELVLPPLKNCSKISHKSTSNHDEKPPLPNGFHPPTLP